MKVKTFDANSAISPTPSGLPRPPDFEDLPAFFLLYSRHRAKAIDVYARHMLNAVYAYFDQIGQEFTLAAIAKGSPKTYQSFLGFQREESPCSLGALAEHG